MSQDDKKQDGPQAAEWLVAATRQNAFTALSELGRTAAAIYRGALEEGLDAEEAKAVTEAALAAIMRTAREGQQGD